MLSIIILNYNRREDILYTLKNIKSKNTGGSDFEVILIDQDSTDGSQDAIKKEFPDVTLYCSAKNLGVAGGRNKGAELAQGEILVFIDDDAHFNTVNAIEKIDYLFKQDEKIGIIGFRVLNSDGGVRDWVYNSLNKKNSMKPFYTQQFVGCGHAIRANLFQKVGGYSEELFFWGEEIEFCLKTFRDTHYHIIYHPSIEVVHRVSMNSRYHWKSKRTAFKSRNRFVLLNNYFPKTSPFYYIFYVYFFVGYLIRSIQYKALKFFINGFCESFSMKISDKKLNVKQASRYSFCYLRQYIGHPRLYKK